MASVVLGPIKWIHPMAYATEIRLNNPTPAQLADLKEAMAREYGCESKPSRLRITWVGETLTRGGGVSDNYECDPCDTRDAVYRLMSTDKYLGCRCESVGRIMEITAIRTEPYSEFDNRYIARILAGEGDKCFQMTSDLKST